MYDVAVAFHELSFVPEGDEVVVGRVDTDSYAVLPGDGAALLRKMAEGMPPDQAARWYESTYGEQVDMDEFLETLHELGFVRSGETADGEAHGGAAPGRLPLRWLARAAFSPFAVVVYVAVLAAWLLAAVRHGDLLPRPRHMFFTDSLIVVQFGILFGQLPLIYLHEASHMLAGRRLGLRSRLGISNRYFYIVFETKMNGLLSVERSKRYMPFLSGMACDVVVFSLLGLLADLTRTPGGDFSLIGRIALALAFTVLTRFIWQFQLYLRTDLYYVFATALNCHDLHDASTALLRNRIWRLLGKPRRAVDEQQWTEHDRRVGRWYGPFILLGVLVMLGFVVLGSLPVTVQYVEVAVQGLRAGPSHAAFWDGAVAMVLLVTWLVLPAYLSWRKRRPARTRPAGPVLTEGVN
ncbi:hypothetical protein Skr01_54090 [Sphaerisporangium krabiense]|uniref:PqqD family protein n=1 Tax=Sphaerisporangium krabiense TaxID=763782 RepID=A0A7W8Z482_9ACTN|nr:hypothetical protein [Sphaerisporangium krabiense]MBB5627168.1 hypothetical protein [Sphaerisporangium krabiense]GII65324.1 hypothetical protein Skr01_54090 [Sphaerisporangium krabiense]